MHNTDILIIGSGPVGLFTVFQAGMLGMKTLVVDALEKPGGQCIALYPEKPIYDIPAQPEISGSDLIDNLLKQAAPFHPQYLLNQTVDSLTKIDAGWHVKTSAGEEIHAKAIIIAAGCGAFGPNKPPLESIDEYDNKSVFYFVNRRDDFKDKTIVIAGGGDSAVDWANSLSEIAKKVYLVHRRDKFRAMDASIEKMKKSVESGKLEMVIPYQLEALEGSNGFLNKVIVKDLNDNIRAIEADVLLPFFGLKMDLGPINSWGLNLEKHHIHVNHLNQQTNIDSIFAVGDICTYEGKLKLILTGFAEAAKACHNAYKFVFPNKALHFEYSTSKGVKEL